MVSVSHEKKRTRLVRSKIHEAFPRPSPRLSGTSSYPFLPSIDPYRLLTLSLNVKKIGTRTLRCTNEAFCTLAINNVGEF